MIDRFDPEAKSSELVSGDNDQFRLPFLLEVRPPNEFYYDAAKNKLTTLRLGEDDGTQVSFNVPGDYRSDFDDDLTHCRQGQLLRLSGWVDIDSRTTVGCLPDSYCNVNYVLRLDVQVHFFRTYSGDVLQRIYLAIMLHV